MHHVNDDMDEVFRRAGKDYPLDTGGANWERIAKELDIPAGEKPASRSSNKKFLWLLLLIPFSFICTQYFADNGKVDIAEVQSGKSIPVRPVTENKNNDVANRSQKPGQVEPVDPGRLSKEFNAQEQVARSETSTIEESNAKTRNEKRRLKPRLYDHVGDEVTVNLVGGNTTNDPSGRVDNVFFKRSNQQFFLSSRSYPSLNVSPSLAEERNIAVSALSEKPKEEERSKRFYAGLIGGVDATSVKFQKVENAGYDFGLLVGYKFGKKWSVEAGILQDKKFYYSDGEYFNSSKLYIPPNSKITSVDGNCNMWELPLSIRYNIKTSPKHSWFVTGGVSSYFMKKENYSYGYYYLSTGQTHYYDHSYENSSKSFFSVVQVSGGYAHRLGKVADLRVEPYFKIPVRGVGIGSMRFQSAGIRIGFTKEVF